MVQGGKGEPAARGGLGGNDAKLEEASPTEQGSPTKQSTAIPLAAAGFSTGAKAEGAVFAPFQALRKSSSQKQSDKKVFY